jgi:hypothetical protein
LTAGWSYRFRVIWPGVDTVTIAAIVHEEEDQMTKQPTRAAVEALLSTIARPDWHKHPANETEFAAALLACCPDVTPVMTVTCWSPFRASDCARRPTGDRAGGPWVARPTSGRCGKRL